MLPIGPKKAQVEDEARGFIRLYLLGIHDHCTPLLTSEIAQAAAALCSFEEARHMMECRGCMLDIKTVRNVTKRFASRARLGQKTDPVIEMLRAENLKGRHQRQTRFGPLYSDLKLEDKGARGQRRHRFLLRCHL